MGGSRRLWLELQASDVVAVEPCGSIHLAHHADELSVLEEFCELDAHDIRMLRPADVAARSSLANLDGLQGAAESPTELRVDDLPAGRYVQWRATLRGTESPALRGVELSYRQLNRRPEITAQRKRLGYGKVASTNQRSTRSISRRRLCLSR